MKGVDDMARVYFASGSLRQHGCKEQVVILIYESDLGILRTRKKTRQFPRHACSRKAAAYNHDLLSALQAAVLVMGLLILYSLPARVGCDHPAAERDRLYNSRLATPFRFLPHCMPPH